MINYSPLKFFSFLIFPIIKFNFWGQVIGSIAGGLLGGKGAGDAADTAAAASDRATEAQLTMYREGEEKLKPWTEAGELGLSEYQRMQGEAGQYADQYAPGEFKFGAEEFEQYKDPGYEWRVGEGLRALDRRMASKGLRRSGMRPRALMELGQQMGSQEFGAARERALGDYGVEEARRATEYGRRYVDPMQRQWSLSEAGRGAGTTSAGMGMETGRGVAQTTQAAGQARAQGVANQYGAWTSALGDVGRIMRQPKQDSWTEYGVSPAEYAEHY